MGNSSSENDSGPPIGVDGPRATQPRGPRAAWITSGTFVTIPATPRAHKWRAVAASLTVHTCTGHPRLRAAATKPRVTVAGPEGTPVSPDVLELLSGAIRRSGDPFVPLRVGSYRPASFTTAFKVKVDPLFDKRLAFPRLVEALRAEQPNV
jgi:hypothetical protein